MQILRKKIKTALTPLKSGGGFTIIEILIATGIIIALSAIVFANYGKSGQQMALQRSAAQLAQDIRRVQGMALSAKDIQGAPANFGFGFGIYFNPANPDFYTIFADFDNSNSYTAGDYEISSTTLSGGIAITGLSPANPNLSVVFSPPDPKVWVNGAFTDSQITLSLNNQQKQVEVKSSGLVSVGSSLSVVCRNDSECNDGNACHYSFDCVNEGETNSYCNFSTRSNGYDCGDCRTCQTGICTYLCQGTESSCECVSDVCRDCSFYYGEDCGDGNCPQDQVPSWSCGAGACQASCVSGSCGGGNQTNGTACTLSSQCLSNNCIDGYCCDSDCAGNCNRCNVGGFLGICTNVSSDCTGNCDICSNGLCQASASLCTGNCDICQGSGNSFSCAASNTLCSNDDSSCFCDGSGTSFNCQPCGQCKNCSSYSCNNVTCSEDTTGSLCSGTSICSGSASCISKIADGGLCTVSGCFTCSPFTSCNFCNSNHCANNICGQPPPYLFEKYNTTDNQSSGAIHTVNWQAQTFTPAISHSLSKVKLKLFRLGNPGTITASIKATDASGHPTGSDLCSGTTSGNTLPTGSPYEWREIIMSGGCNLSAGTKYAIVIRALSGNASNYAIWRRYTSNAYSGGNRESSTNSGSSWSASASNEMLFEEWGQ